MERARKRREQEDRGRIKLTLKYERADSTEAERAYVVAAAVEGRISQTHYANPGAETIRSNGLARNTMRHFLRLRNAIDREYIIKLNEKTNKTISIVTPNIAA